MVQGVGYRYFVRRTASALGIAGYVRNSPDGSVEVLAEGDRSSVEALIEELRTGARYAVVDQVVVAWEEPKADFEGFDYAV